MLPSMPLICSTPDRVEEPLLITPIKNNMCFQKSDSSDSNDIPFVDLVAIAPVSPLSFTSLNNNNNNNDHVVSGQVSEIVPSAFSEVSLGNQLSSSTPVKKSSPLKVVSPILKKYNSQRQGRILKRSLSPKPSQTCGSHTVSHTDSVEQKSNHESENSSVDNEADLVALMEASSTVPRAQRGKQAPVNKKKRLKEIRDAKVMLALLGPDSEVYQRENAKNFAQAYFHKLQERLEENSDGELFQHILQLFGEFEAKTTPVQKLYEKLTTSLHRYPDLAELFNLFLLPDQAMECGRFMEYLKLINMKIFVRKLEIFFSKQPQQMRQVLSALTVLSEKPNVTMGEVKAAVIPLLKGNTFLIDSFLSLFHCERSPNSFMTDFEDMEIDSDHSGDEEETIVIPDQEDPYGTDTCLCSCHSSDDDKYSTRHLHCISCGTKFIHGKVYLHIGRVLRPVKVTFPGLPDEVVQQRLFVKVNRKTRRKNLSPSKNPQVSPNSLHGEEKVETEDDQKSSSPKTNKTAKSKAGNPGPKPRVNIVKASSNCVKSNSMNSECKENVDKIIEDVVSDTGLPITTTSTGGPTSAHNNCAKTVDVASSLPMGITPEAFRSPDKVITGISPLPSSQENLPETPKLNEICDDNISIASDIGFYTCDSTDSNMPLIDMINTDDFGAAINDFQMELMEVEEASSVRPHESSECSEFSSRPISDLNMETPDLLQYIADSVPVPENIGVREEFKSSSESFPGLDEHSTNVTESFSNKTENKECVNNVKTTLVNSALTLNAPNEACSGTLNDSLQNPIRSEINSNVDSTIELEQLVPTVEETNIDHNSTVSLDETQVSANPVLVPIPPGHYTADNPCMLTETKDHLKEPSPVPSPENRPLELTSQLSEETKSPVRPWTREEDRVILVQAQLGFSMEETFVNIKKGLPDRAVKEIRERFQVLMKILQEMTNSSVCETSDTAIISTV